MAAKRGYLLTLAAFFTFVQWTAAEKCCKWNRNDSAPLITILRASGYSGTVRITCIASGIPKPTISWTFKGATVLDNDHYDFKYDNQSMLIIKDTTFADTGKYRCTAKNYFGAIFGDIEVKIKAVGQFKEGFEKDDECQYRNVTIGRPYELKCPPHTDSYGQQYSWVVIPLEVWKAGYPLDHIFTSRNGSLMFSHVKRSDIALISGKGGLSCGLVVDLTIIPSVSIKLISHGEEFTGTAKPKITVFMEKKTVAVKGETVKLLCGAIGKPHPKFTWLKNGKRIYSPLDKSFGRGQVVVEGKGMVIIFRSIRMSDAGTYTCLAVNSAGRDQKEATLIVDSPVRWSKSLPLHNALPVRDSIRLECVAEGKPKPTYKWMQNETEIQPSALRRIQDGLLEIDEATFSDAGFYLCVAQNYINTKVTATFVDVRAFPPSIVTAFNDTNYFLTGDQNSLFCDVTGGPLPLLRWYHNDKPLSSHASRLLFDASSKSDNGVYKCVAQNVEGDVEQSTVVNVYDRTRITIAPSNFSFLEGSVANLFCDAEFDTTLDVTFEWLKNGKLLNYDKRIHIKKGIKWRTTGLQINDLLLSDVGAYTCRVFTNNKATFRSIDEKTGSITVIGAPRKPQNVKLEGDCTGDEIKLVWSAPSKYIGPMNHYIVEYSHVDEDGKWFKYNTANQIMETSVVLQTNKLPASASIIFRVRAVSVDGDKKTVGKACEGTKIGGCVIPSGVPFTPVMGLQADMDNLGNLTVSWDKLDKIMQPGPGFKVIAKHKKIVNGTVVMSEQTEVDGDENSFTIPVGESSPNDDVKYEVTVYGENQKGPGPKTTITVQHPSNVELPTSKVRNVAIDSVTSNTVNLKWTEVSTATGYMIYYNPKEMRRRRAVPKSKVKSHKVPKGDSGVIDGLKPNTKYKITVAALNMKGEGPRSDPVEVLTKKGVPGIPKDVDLKTYGQAIVLGWTPPDGNVTGYDVKWYPSEETDPNKHNTQTLPPHSQQAFITSDLKPLTYYTVELNAKSDGGKGKPWKMVGVVVGKADVPGKPDPPVLVGLNESVINATFRLPTLLDGGLPNKFHVFYVKKGEPDVNIEKESGVYPETSSVLLTGLDLEQYRVWTVAVNNEGSGEKSNEVDGIPLAPTLPPPTTTTPMITEAPTTPNTTNITIAVVETGRSTDEGEAFYKGLWFIILIALIILIIIILFIICAILNRNGGKYPVGEKEKKFGGWDNQQLQDYSDNPMEKPNGLPFKDNISKRSGSNSSITKPIIDDNDDDNDSLDFYGEDNKFTEDGSFIGEYGDDKQSYTNNNFYT